MFAASARLSGIAAGLHAVLHLPGTSSSEAGLLAHLAEHEVTVDGLSHLDRRPEASPVGIGLDADPFDTSTGTSSMHLFAAGVDHPTHGLLNDQNGAPGSG